MLSLVTVSGVALGWDGRSARADSAPADPGNPATPATVAADQLPTVQIDGVAWSQVVVGNTVYVAGQFGHARPSGAAPGTQQVVRNNLLAYDIRTGALITSFAPNLNAQALVVTASPDGSRIYVGGDFTTADGQTRNRVAAYDTATGALVPTFHPSVGGRVRAIAATGSTVYLGGMVSSVGSAARNRLAAVSAATGAVLPWAPQPGVGPTSGNRDGNTKTSNEVMAMVVTAGGSQVVVGGRFDSLNGAKATGVGAVDAVSGATRPFAVNGLITNQGINSAVYSLSTDGATVYGSGYDYFGPGNLESAFAADATTGALRWVSSCHGDTYSTYPAGAVLYMASHAHDCGNIGGYPDQNPLVHKFATAFSTAATGVNGPFTISNANFAGKPAPSLLPWFPDLQSGTVTGQGQAGWSVSGNGQYVVYGGEFPMVNGVGQQGLVRFAVRSIAPNKRSPLSTGFAATAVSLGAGTARVGWTQTSDMDNENLVYRVVRDGGSTPVAQVSAPSQWWNEQQLAVTDTGLAAGTHTYQVSATDPFGNVRTTAAVQVAVAAGSTAARPYATMVTADGATHLWSLGEASGATAYDRVGSADLTVNGGVSRGATGAVPGDGDKASSFNGTATGFAATKQATVAPQQFSVEAWFQTISTTGGKIVGFGNAATGTSVAFDRHVYMDPAGHLVFGVYTGVNQAITTARSYNDGKWHHVVGTLGGGRLTLYVDGQAAASLAGFTIVQPMNGYWRVGGDTVWGSGGKWFAGRIDEVAVYPAALTASQVSSHFSAGTTGTVPNIAPTASFTTSTAQLGVAVDGSASRDPDGSIATWAWDFGDGATGSGATASHTYAAAGTYPVRLTVTDARGATGTATTTVSVTAPPTGPGSIARDSFGRDVASGWGTAEVGGNWATAGTASVTGGAGVLSSAPSATTVASLGAVARADVALQATLTVPQAPTGGGTYVTLGTQRVGSSSYGVKLRFGAGGVVTASLVATVSGSDTVLGTYTVAGALPVGTPLTVRFQTSGSGPTTLAVSAWPSTAAQPAAWQLVRTDTTAALQRPGALFVQQYNSGSATATSLLRVDDLEAEPAA